MMEFVQEYLDGTLERLDWDLDFIHYLITHYPKMERKDAAAAECFNYYLAERGFDLGKGLSDTDHRKLIQRQFDEFKAVVREGFL